MFDRVVATADIPMRSRYPATWAWYLGRHSDDPDAWRNFVDSGLAGRFFPYEAMHVAKGFPNAMSRMRLFHFFFPPGRYTEYVYPDAKPDAG